MHLLKGQRWDDFEIASTVNQKFWILSCAFQCVSYKSNGVRMLW